MKKTLLVGLMAVLCFCLMGCANGSWKVVEQDGYTYEVGTDWETSYNEPFRTYYPEGNPDNTWADSFSKPSLMFTEYPFSGASSNDLQNIQTQEATIAAYLEVMSEEKGDYTIILETVDQGLIGDNAKSIALARVKSESESYPDREIVAKGKIMLFFVSPELFVIAQFWSPTDSFTENEAMIDHVLNSITLV